MADTQQIDIPGVGVVEFPSSMSDADISAAARQLHTKAAANSAPSGPTLDLMMSRLWGKPVVGPPTSDDPANDEPNMTSRLVHGMSGLSNPQTASDFAGLLIPAGEGVQIAKRILSPVTEGISKYGNSVIDAGIGLLPAKAQKALTVLGELKPSNWNSPFTAAGRDARATAAAVQPAGELSQQLSRVPPTAPAYAEPAMSFPPAASHTPTAPPPSGAGLSDVERAALVKQGYTPDVIAKIEGQLQPIASHASGAAPNVPPASQMISSEGPFAEPPTAQGPTAADREAAALTRINGSHPLTQPRVDVGAEDVGRANGLSKEAVRAATGPLYGEAPGEAAPVFPESDYQRMATKMRQMHPSPGNPAGDAAAWDSRLAYANKARNEKSLSQLISMMRAWRDVHMAVPAAVGAGALARHALTDNLQGTP